MENLAQIESIKQKIKTASATTITALHKFIFQEEGDRGNRRCLRSFQGFTFHERAQEHIDKLEYAQRLTIGDLISCCHILGLEYDGNKEEIITRICNGLNIYLNTLAPASNPEDTEEENEEENREINEENISENESLHSVRTNRQTPMKFSMSYRDVEAYIRPFTGSDAYPVERWIADFEDTATLFNWTKLHKVVFAKKSLKGLAKMFIESEGVIKTWRK